MKKILKPVIVAAAFLAAISVQAQTADEIIGKYIDAIGGKDLLKQVTSIRMEGTTQVMGNESPTTITLLNGKGYKSELDFGGMKATQCYTDKGGWTINPQSCGEAEAMTDDMYQSGKSQIYAGGSLFDYASKGGTATLAGKEGNTYKIKLVTADKTESTYYIDASTYYLSKVVRQSNFMGQPTEITVQLADYRKTDFGLVVPFTVNTDLGQFQLAASFSKAIVNQPVDPAIFNMPK